MFRTICKLFIIAVVFSPTVVNARSAPDSFADLAEKLLPSVVNISTTHKSMGRAVPNEMQQFKGTPFEPFFKDFFNDRHTEREVSSLGSGFIIDEKGIIITNYHVINKAEEIKVILSDDTVLEATIIGKDKKTDIAVLQVKTDKKLIPVEFGDSDKIRIGDWILAIGNPFGLGGTVTSGIISARARDIHFGPYDDYLQTDASINRGNSGGPMFNMSGKVIGINTAIFSPTGGSVGIGFAIPTNMVKKIIADLREYGHTRRGLLGVKIQMVTDEIAESLGLDKAKGALVASVDKEGPAFKAGVQNGDIIIEFDGHEIKEMRQLPRIVAETKIGKKIKIVVLRNGHEKTFNLKIGEMKEDEIELAGDIKKNGKTFLNGKKMIEPLGIEVSSLTKDIRLKFNIPDDIQGVFITEVAQNSDIAKKGIRKGDILVEVNQHKVNSPADIEKQLEAVKKSGRKSVLLLIVGKAGLRFVAVKLHQ